MAGRMSTRLQVQQRPRRAPSPVCACPAVRTHERNAAPVAAVSVLLAHVAPALAEEPARHESAATTPATRVRVVRCAPQAAEVVEAAKQPSVAAADIGPEPAAASGSAPTLLPRLRGVASHALARVPVRRVADTCGRPPRPAAVTAREARAGPPAADLPTGGSAAHAKRHRSTEDRAKHQARVEPRKHPGPRGHAGEAHHRTPRQGRKVRARRKSVGGLLQCPRQGEPRPT